MDLSEVVHHPDVPKPGLFCSLRDRRDLAGTSVGIVRPVEAAQHQSEGVRHFSRFDVVALRSRYQLGRYRRNGLLTEDAVETLLFESRDHIVEFRDLLPRVAFGKGRERSAFRRSHSSGGVSITAA